MNLEEMKTAAVALMDDVSANHCVDLAAFTQDAAFWTLLTGDQPIADYAQSIRQTSGRNFDGPGRLEIQRITAEGDTVAVEALGKQALKNGRSYDNTYVWIVTFRNGKICRVRAFFDTARAIKSMR